MKKKLNQYIQILNKEIDIHSAVLFGSYAKKTAKKGSDVDIVIVSNAFRNQRGVKRIAYLLGKTRGLDMDIEPLGYTVAEWKNASPVEFVGQIKSEGIVIYKNPNNH